MLRWLNRNIAAMGIASLLSDFSDQMATVVLPTFLVSLGGTPATLGFIEGVADAAVSFMKLFAGWYSDKIGKRKPFAVVGYALTTVGVGLLMMVTNWYQLLLARLIGWTGKGLRKPPRDALLVESTQPQFYGRVFGFHRGMDTLGAIIGPIVAYLLIPHVSYKILFFAALIPGVIAVMVMLGVQEIPGRINNQRHLITDARALPRSFFVLLIATTLCALGKYAESMLVLRITQLLDIAYSITTASSVAILLYAMRNMFYAFGAVPLGALADRLGKKRVLVVGYLLSVGSSIGLAYTHASLAAIIGICMVSGLSLAITDATEKSVAADFIPPHMLGTGFGVIALVGGFAAFFSSSIIGLLWTAVSPWTAFMYSAVMFAAGMVILSFGVPTIINHRQDATI